MSSEISISREPDDEWYDPELPFLSALERDVRRHARHVARARQLQRAHGGRSHSTGAAAPTVSDSGAARSRARTSRLAPASGRVARRSLTLLALLSLIGASAFGAGRIFSGGAPNPATVHQSAFVPVSYGASGHDLWSLRMYTRSGELCRVLTVSEAEASRCSAPLGSRSLGATSVLSPTHRYLFGIGGGTIDSVVVHVRNGASRRVPTHPLPGAVASRTKLHAADRWYVVILSRPIGEPDPPVHVQGLDRSGHPVGTDVVDCVETSEPQGCPS